MHFHRTPLVAAAAVAAALPAFAFFPPVDSRDGVTARLVGFDELSSDANGVQCARRDASAPFEIRLDLANATVEPVSGDLRIWLGDDWDLDGEATRRVTLPPHSTNSFFATAIPRPGRVLPALYPVHADFSFPGGDPLHPIAVFEAREAVAAAPSAAAEANALPIRLALLPGVSFSQLPGADPKAIAEDRETGAFFHRGWYAADGDVRFGFFSQPPWRTGGGFGWRDIPVALPDAAPLTLHLSAAIRPPLRAGEGRSDGADYKVFVVDEAGRATEVYSAFVKSSSWTDGTADLSPWAGQRVTIRLWNGCGPANDPNYDRCLWGNVGIVGEDMKQADLFAANAAHEAKAVRPEQIRVFSLSLSPRGEAWTASFTPGPSGLLDGALSFTDGDRTLSFRGFTCAIDDVMVGSGPLDARCTGCEVLRDDGDVVVSHRIDLRDGRTVLARATLCAEGPALRVRWDMPGAERGDRGSPRFTRLGIGPGSLPAARAYVSFGNVLEEPRSFELTDGLFRNLASHAGADYANGASLCQAADSLPRIVCRRDSNVFAVETCGDATLSFVPSARGAFAAARAWRDVAGLRPGAGWREAATRMCLDQWGGPTAGFAKAAAALDTLAKYGVTNAVYVRHVWQRWGFDYRLPEIWPLDNRQPHGSQKVFLDLVATARRHGILFVPHDNYIDHYPDAAGFSYDDAVFDENGEPVKAWFNSNAGKRAQSYRWAPGAYMPDLRANAAALKDGFAPDGIFLDVFSNMAPFDGYDRAGRFHGRAETRAAWAEAFDEYRRILGTNAVTIGEAGHDALVGHLDAGQPDHFTPGRWMDRSAYADSERVPWQDVVTHGSFVLYGGGLGWRYASDSPERGPHTASRGSSSDSYLCTTVMGGRTPSYDFDPFDLRAVNVWWLLGPVSRDLALSAFESFSFEGSIHRQHAVFAGGEGGGGQVWVNRAPEPWTVAGGTLPKDGFYAETAGARAGIVELAGRRCAFSECGGTVFVDGRPDRNDGTGPADAANATALADFAPLGIKTDGAFRLERDGDRALLLTPIPDMGRPFRVELDLAKTLGAAAAATASAVEPVDPTPGAARPDWKQTGATLLLSVDAKSFAYRVSF